MGADTLQWILGIGLFVAFLLIMLRGCGGMMGGMGCGMGEARPAQKRHNRSDDSTAGQPTRDTREHR